MLRTNHYLYVFNKLASKDHRGKRNDNAYKDAEEIIRVEGAVPAIISPEEFRLAQMKINSRKRSRAANNAKEVYLIAPQPNQNRISLN